MAKNAFTVSNFKWSLNGLKKCIKDNNLKSKILFSNENGAIVHVVNYEESVILGAESDWCISQHECSWKQYVENRKAVQLFFYCFKEKLKDNTLYGATFDIKNGKVKTYCCFTRPNEPIAKVKGFPTDEEALFKTVIEPIFGNIKEELGEAIVNANSSSPIKEEFKETELTWPIYEYNCETLFGEMIENLHKGTHYDYGIDSYCL